MTFTLVPPREPFWITLPYGIAVRVRPVSTAVIQAATFAARESLEAIIRGDTEAARIGGRFDGLPDLDSEAGRFGVVQQFFAVHLAWTAIMEWTGVNDAGGNDALLTLENVALLMQYNTISESFSAAYTRAERDLVAEGNGSWPSADGISAAGQPIARDAAPPVPPAPPEGADQTATIAPITHTGRAARKARRSGVS